MRPSRNMVQLADFVIQTAHSLGIALQPTSRIGQMRKVLLDADGKPRYVPADAPGFQIALEGLRDLQIIAFILDYLRPDLADDHFRVRIKTMLKDAALPQESGADTKGRDTQCELFVEAVCMKAGLQPKFAEPDIHAFDGSRPVGLAVKRIKSLKSFHQRVEDGIDQIQRSSISGIVVADVTTAMNPENQRVVTPASDIDFGRAMNLHLRSFADPEVETLYKQAKGTRALGMILIYNHVRLLPAGQWSLESMTYGINLVRFNDRRAREFDTFTQRFFSGLATPPEPSYRRIA
jgi:hypothetical protein